VPEITHATSIASESRPGGDYGPFGHGVWSVVCTCGWRTTTWDGGRNAAEMVSRNHLAHQHGAHRRPAYGCVECGRY
jgi:hypothetical protein